MRRISSFFLIFVLISAASTIKRAQAIASSETIPVRLTATVIHAQLPPSSGNEQGSTSLFYSNKLDGVINMHFLRDGSELQVAFLLPNSDSASHLSALWTPGVNSSPVPAGPIQMCLARDEISEQRFNSWMNGGGTEDPTLVIPLQLTSGFWVNSAQVVAQLFARRCGGGGNQFQKYADLSIPAGALRVLLIEGQHQLSLSASQAAVSNISQNVWAEILDCGNGHVQLPSTASPGISNDLAGLSLQQSGPPALDESIGRVALRVDALVADDFLRRAHARLLTRWLDEAADDLRRAQPFSSINALNQVQRHAENWMRSGILAPEAGKLLLSDTASAISNINQVVFAQTSLPPLEVCNPQPSCVYTTFFVDGRTRLPPSERTGSRSRPFKTLTEALASAADLNLCGVELRVQGSSYREDLTITRNTRIIGSPVPVLSGSIINSGPYDLHVENIVIERSGELGAVVVQNSCARTTIRFVAIYDAKRYGIRQRGGSLLVAFTSIVRTVAEPGVIASGTAIYLTGGVKANLGFVGLDQNESGALVAASTGTEVSAAGVVASRNRISPFLADELLRTGMVDNGTAAVEARSGALLNMSLCRITDNEHAGLYVHSGAQAQFNFGTISGTRELAGTCVGDCGSGGFNARVTQSAQLLMRGVILSGGALVGLQIAREGFANLSNSQVIGNLIGINVQVPGFDSRNLTDRVLFRDNVRNLDAEVLPTPSIDGTPES